MVLVLLPGARYAQCVIRLSRQDNESAPKERAHHGIKWCSLFDGVETHAYAIFTRASITLQPRNGKYNITEVISNLYACEFGFMYNA